MTKKFIKHTRIISLLTILILSSTVSCESDSDTDNSGIDEKEITIKKDPIIGTRIAWDYSSLQRIVPLAGNSINYSSYPRMIEIKNGNFLCVYEADRNIDLIISTDKGVSWSQPQRIVSYSNKTVMAVPEIVQLSNDDLIISYNQRPETPYSSDRKFSIKTIISKDNGSTWANDKLIYEADYTFENGCWEPNIIELSDGELQLYFANEAEYTYSHEQNISMLRSNDKGETWGEIEIVSFSPTSRDGMPVALYLNETGETIFAIEDNYERNFKPAIIRTSNNWQNAPVARNTSDREYALNHNQSSAAYQGAPYIRKLPSGNIVLSYQGTDGENNHDISNARMLVEVGNKEGIDFTNKTTPFDVPTGKSGLWNSLSVMDGKVWAISATNAYSNKSEVWSISGYEIVESYKIPTGLINTNNKYPFFVGHKNKSNVGVYVSQDNSILHLKAEVTDNAIVNEDGVSFYLDPKNVSSTYPVSNTFKISVKSDGTYEVKEGFNGSWVELDLSLNSISVNKNSKGYSIDISINWSGLGGKPGSNQRIGFSVSLTDFNPENGQGTYAEDLVFSNSSKPYTWASIEL